MNESVYFFVFQVFRLGYDGDNAARDVNATSKPFEITKWEGFLRAFLASPITSLCHLRNQTNKYLTTALHYAAQRGHVDASSGTDDDKDSERLAMKVGKVRMHSIWEGFFSFLSGKKCDLSVFS